MAAHKNHQKETYKRMRAVVLWLHDNECFISKKKSNNLDCHHCDHDSTNNSILNLVPLDNEVHKLITKSKGNISVTPADIIELLENKLLHFKSLL